MSDTSPIRLSIRGMTCAACVSHIEKALAAVLGVKSVQVELQPGRAVVDHDGANLEQLIAAVAEEGYEAELEK